MRYFSSSSVLFTLILLSAATTVLSDDKGTAAAELAKLEGSWAFVSLESGGKPAPAESLKEMKSIRLTIKGSTLTISRPGEAAREQTISIDATKNPQQIDITRGNDKGTKRTALGIYKIEGKILKICTDDSGTERPTEFTSKEKHRAVSVVVLERQ